MRRLVAIVAGLVLFLGGGAASAQTPAELVPAKTLAYVELQQPAALDSMRRPALGCCQSARPSVTTRAGRSSRSSRAPAPPSINGFDCGLTRPFGNSTHGTMTAKSHMPLELCAMWD